MKTVIVDLDGTLALISHRQHLIKRKGRAPDWDGFFLACDKDKPNYPVIETVKLYKQAGYRIHIFSGRGKIAEQKTLAWLEKYQIPYDAITMREEKDYTPDDQLKETWLKHYYPDFLQQVFMVLDDRNKVVNMWRTLGLTCLQVAEGNF